MTVTASAAARGRSARQPAVSLSSARFPLGAKSVQRWTDSCRTRSGRIRWGTVTSDEHTSPGCQSRGEGRAQGKLSRMRGTAHLLLIQSKAKREGRSSQRTQLERCNSTTRSDTYVCGVRDEEAGLGGRGRGGEGKGVSLVPVRGLASTHTQSSSNSHLSHSSVSNLTSPHPNIYDRSVIRLDGKEDWRRLSVLTTTCVKGGRGGEEERLVSRPDRSHPQVIQHDKQEPTHLMVCMTASVG
jgi:hypothetical protein